jgi:hypothetical protein
MYDDLNVYSNQIRHCPCLHLEQICIKNSWNATLVKFMNI